MLLLCKTLSWTAAAFTPMQIAFYTEARRVGISPQQPSLGQIISFVPCCCCAKQPYSRTASAAFTPMQIVYTYADCLLH